MNIVQFKQAENLKFTNNMFVSRKVGTLNNLIIHINNRQLWNKLPIFY